MLRSIFLSGLLSIASATAYAQSADYSAASKLGQYHEWKRELTDLASTIKLISFATKCGAIETSSANYAILISENAFAMSWIRRGVIGNSPAIKALSEEQDATLKKAITDGSSIASTPGKCDFWKNHPDDLYTIRRDIANIDATGSF